MRMTVKKWGNGLAIRLPRSSVEFGALHEGLEVEVTLRPVDKRKDWKPYTCTSGLSDLSTHHDDYAWGYLAERFGKGRRT